MVRLVGVVVAASCFLSPAAASLDRPKAPDRLPGLRLIPAIGFYPDATEVPPPAQAQITDETEVFLDGRRCRYKDVPASASVARMVLAADGKTITRVEFSTRK